MMGSVSPFKNCESDYAWGEKTQLSCFGYGLPPVSDVELAVNV